MTLVPADDVDRLAFYSISTAIKHSTHCNCAVEHSIKNNYLNYAVEGHWV